MVRRQKTRGVVSHKEARDTTVPSSPMCVAKNVNSDAR